MSSSNISKHVGYTQKEERKSLTEFIFFLFAHLLSLMLPVPDCGRRLKILFCLVFSRIFLFYFSFFIPSQSRQKISQHCGAEKKRFYTVCAITCIPHLTSLVGRVVCTRRRAVCIYKNFCSFFFIFRPTFEI
jgi:uncharacterized membrane protein